MEPQFSFKYLSMHFTYATALACADGSENIPSTSVVDDPEGHVHFAFFNINPFSCDVYVQPTLGEETGEGFIEPLAEGTGEGEGTVDALGEGTVDTPGLGTGEAPLEALGVGTGEGVLPLEVGFPHLKPGTS